MPSNAEITEDHVKIIDNAGIDRVKIRSVLACETRRGICSCATAVTWRAATWSTSARRSA